MIIVAADTSTSTNTVAVCSRDHVLAETIVEAGRRHSERLLETVQWLLAEASLALTDIDCLAISTGPGSFTGLRVGVATFKGLASGLQRPLVGVPTFDAMSRLVLVESGVICPVLDARMKEVFAAAYDVSPYGRQKIVDDCVCPLDAFLARVPAPALFYGQGASLYHDQILAAMPTARFAPPMHAMPRASAVAAEAYARLDAGDAGDAGRVVPVYLRKSQAELNRAAATAKES